MNDDNFWADTIISLISFCCAGFVGLSYANTQLATRPEGSGYSGPWEVLAWRGSRYAVGIALLIAHGAAGWIINKVQEWMS